MDVYCISDKALFTIIPPLKNLFIHSQAADNIWL